MKASAIVELAAAGVAVPVVKLVVDAFAFAAHLSLDWKFGWRCAGLQVALAIWHRDCSEYVH